MPKRTPKLKLSPTVSTYQLHIKYSERPSRTQLINVKGTLQDVFRKADSIYRSDDLNLIHSVRVHSDQGVFIGKVETVRGGIAGNNDDD